MSKVVIFKSGHFSLSKIIIFGLHITPPLLSPVFVPDATPEPQPPFCRLRGLGVTALRACMSEVVIFSRGSEAGSFPARFIDLCITQR